MPLETGTRLGHYEIVELIGKGGMGEVYRAHDPRLGRDVAIKVSSSQFTERFDREARAVAALNHPNICTLHDVGPNYLVMEFVEGEAPKGPLPLDETLRIFRQIADALEAAHEKGIVHRDLKPGNIKIKPDGTVKVLDFGLAKVAPAEARATSEESPTISMAATQAGVILGTAAYMAPEQARGKPVDKRADIWAFGVVFHEILTGRRLFQGEDITETLASVVKEQADLTEVPVEVRRFLKKCLEKDPRKRLRDIGDVWELLEEPKPAAPVTAGTDAPPPAKSLWPWAVAAAFLLISAALAFLRFRETPVPQHLLRYSIAAPENSNLHSLAVSPDGRYLAIAAAANGKRQLWLRDLNTLQLQPMPFTEDATYPFWSPDSRNIGFFAQGKLKKIAASGGPSQSLCDVEDARGGSWNRDDVILFGPTGGSVTALRRVSANGGVSTTVGQAIGNARHPVFLPDGRHFLFINYGGAEKAGIYVGSLDGAENRHLLADVTGALFEAGHLLFVRENTLMAQPFDPGKGQLAGDVFPVADGVSLTTNQSYAPVTVSANGLLLYLSGGTTGSNRIAWVDRDGKAPEPIGPPGNLLMPTISPDEKSIGYTRNRVGGGGSDLWVRELLRGAEKRFTTDSSLNGAFNWSPGGDRAVFVSNRGGAFDIYQKPTTATGQDEPLLSTRQVRIVNQWSRDGRFIVYSEIGKKFDLWFLPLPQGSAFPPLAERKPVLFLQTEFNENQGQLSPDGHWMAYVSDESGRQEVYVRPFPPADGAWPVSTAGGEQPRWSGNGKELFYVAADGKMMAVPIKASPGESGTKRSFEPGAPMPLFDAHLATTPGSGGVFQYDVTKDGKRFLVDMTAIAGSATPLTVVVGWDAGFKK